MGHDDNDGPANEDAALKKPGDKKMKNFKKI